MGLFLILLIIITVLLWPQISRWLQRFMLRRAESYFRKAAGMPPPPKQSRSDRSRRKAGTQTSRRPDSHDEPIIPKEYAEDVDFVEVKVFQETEIRVEKKPGYTEYQESQVTDAEWEEVKQQ